MDPTSFRFQSTLSRPASEGVSPSSTSESDHPPQAVAGGLPKVTNVEAETKSIPIEGVSQHAQQPRTGRSENSSSSSMASTSSTESSISGLGHASDTKSTAPWQPAQKSPEALAKLCELQAKDPNEGTFQFRKDVAERDKRVSARILADAEWRLAEGAPQHRQARLISLHITWEGSTPNADPPESRHVQLDSVEGSTIVVSAAGSHVDRYFLGGFVDGLPGLGGKPMWIDAKATYDPSADRTTYRIDVANITTSFSDILRFRHPIDT